MTAADLSNHRSAAVSPDHQSGGLNSNWITVVGTLGGVAITAATGLLTLVFTERNQRSRMEIENAANRQRDLLQDRRAAFLDYLGAYRRMYSKGLDVSESGDIDQARPGRGRLGYSKKWPRMKCSPSAVHFYPHDSGWR
jgi:hypothetical protein